MGNLSKKIKEYTDMDYYPFHMPGHKRNMKSYCDSINYDITEIDGFDNLHNATGIIADINKKASELYDSDNSFIMVNGSTGGILAAISSVSSDGKRLLLARNSHKSAYNGIFLNRLETSYLYPQNDPEMWINRSIDPEDVNKELENNKNICGVFVTSPTYEGVVSDIGKIVKVAHKYSVPVIVDEAHGAHFGMNEYFPQNAVTCGADIVIQSLHKTLPSVTQTAIIHFNSNIVDFNKFKYFLSVYQTSSPSYLFMISMEDCIDMLLKNKNDIFDKLIKNTIMFREKCNSLEHLKLYNGKTNNFDCDQTRIVISTADTNISGFELYNILQNKYRLQLEMALNNYVIAITSCMDTDEGFLRLYNALYEIDSSLTYKSNKKRFKSIVAASQMTIYEAAVHNGNYVPISNSSGMVSCEFMYVYPPGIPIIAPGELITDEHIELYEYYLGAGAQITGNSKQGSFKVITHPEWR